MITVSLDLVSRVALAEAAILVLLGVVVLAHALLMSWRRRHDPERLRQAGEALAVVLEVEDEHLGPALTGLSRRLRTLLITDLAASLRGHYRERLADVAAELGLLTYARRRARSWWWWRRLHGAHLLSSVFDVDPALPALIDDRNAVVRSEAIGWAGHHLGDDTGDDIGDRVVGRLDDRSLLCRDAALDALIRAGTAAVPAVAANLDDARSLPTPVLGSLLTVAAVRPAPQYLAVLLGLVDDPRPTVRADVARALGSLGGDEAAAGLSTLLDDPEPAVRAAAATGLGRLGHWPAATAIGRRLRDPSWDVRRAAGNALTRLGAPGALLLRHYADDTDPFAADMARRVVRNAELRDTSRARP